jgi:hypothetical protein
MAPQSDDKTKRWRLEEEVHERLMEARKAYEENKTPETRDAYSRALRAFTDLLFRGIPPKEP